MQDDYDIKSIFQEIENKLIISMRRTLWSHREDEQAKGFDWPQWQALKLKQMKSFRENNIEIFKDYKETLNKASITIIKKQFKEGSNKTKKEAIKAGVIRKEDTQLGGSFFRVNDRKLKALIKSVNEDLREVKYSTLRMANDQYRQIIYKSQIYAASGAGTIKQAIDMATEDFLTRGFDCIVYKNGSKHNIADYADATVKTASKRASLMAGGELRKELGNPLVYISKHGGACDKCTPWEGRVYIDNVWSGGSEKDGKYPLLSTAIEGGLFHVRCQHGSSTYYEGINEEPEEVTEAIKSEHQDPYTQALERRKRQFERLALGSLSSKNVEKYQNKVNELKRQIESSKIENNWEDFKTMGEAKEYVYNNYKDSDIDKIRNVESINATFKQLDKLQKQYPLDRKIFVRNKTMSGAAAQGNYQGISINTAHFNKANRAALVGDDWIKDCDKQIEDLKQYLGNMKYKQKPIEKGIKKLEEQKKYNCFSISGSYSNLESIKATISHEYGHVVADQYFGQVNQSRANKNFDFFDSNECWQKCNDVADTYYKAIKNNDIYNISYYASTDRYEFFAECFAKKQMGGILPNYINEMLERVLKNGK